MHGNRRSARRHQAIARPGAVDDSSFAAVWGAIEALAIHVTLEMSVFPT